MSAESSKIKRCIIPLFACDSEGGFGNKGKLPWPSLKNDLIHFWGMLEKEKNHTKVVIMGRKTYESLPKHKRPIKNVINVIISSTMKQLNPPFIMKTGIYVFKSLGDTFELIDKLRNENVSVYLIGGVMLIEELVLIYHDRFKEAVVTRVDGVFEADVKIDIDIMKMLSVYRLDAYREYDVTYTIGRYHKEVNA